MNEFIRTTLYHRSQARQADRPAVHPVRRPVAPNVYKRVQTCTHSLLSAQPHPTPSPSLPAPLPPCCHASHPPQPHGSPNREGRLRLSQDSQSGVLLTVLNSISQHELREALTIYVLLRARGLHLAANDHAAEPPPPAPSDLLAASEASTAAAGRTSPAEVACAGARRAGRALGGGGGRGGAASWAVGAATSAAVTVGEAEQLASDFLELEFGVVAHMDVEACLERLERLGLVQSETMLHGRDDTRAVGGGGYQSYMAVPISEAIALLRRRWGDDYRSADGDSLHGRRQPQPSLVQLTDPLTPWAGRRRASTGEQHSPTGSPGTPFHLSRRDRSK